MKLLLAFALLLPQEFSLDAPPDRQHQFVSYAAENIIIPAGKPSTLELRFVIENGYHVNSHKPNSDLQPPTLIDLKPAAGVKLASANYPAGKLFAFSFDPKEKLDVYQDQFIVKLPITAAAGPHELTGELKYQACNHAACYPPKTLPIKVLFTAK